MRLTVQFYSQEILNKKFRHVRLFHLLFAGQSQIRMTDRNPSLDMPMLAYTPNLVKNYKNTRHGSEKFKIQGGIPSWGLMTVDLICHYHENQTTIRQATLNTARRSLIGSSTLNGLINTIPILLDMNGITNQTASDFAHVALSYMNLGLGAVIAGLIAEGAYKYLKGSREMTEFMVYCHGMYDELCRLHFDKTCGDWDDHRDCRCHYLKLTGEEQRMNNYIDAPGKIFRLYLDESDELVEVLNNWLFVIDKVPGTAEDVPICLAIILRSLSEKNFIHGLQTMIQTELVEKIKNAGKYLKVVKGCLVLMLMTENEDLATFINAIIKTDPIGCRAFLQRKAINEISIKADKFQNMSSVEAIRNLPENLLDLIEKDTELEKLTVDELAVLLKMRVNTRKGSESALQNLENLFASATQLGSSFPNGVISKANGEPKGDLPMGKHFEQIQAVLDEIKDFPDVEWYKSAG